MSKSKSTRSSIKKDDEKAPFNGGNIETLRKIFYIPEEVLKDSDELQLEKFFHPGKGGAALFLTKPDEQIIMEVIEFGEPRRSWLINNDICSNGRIYITTPTDASFLALHYLKKHCSQKALSLDTIHDESDSSANRLLSLFVKEDDLSCIADKKKSGDMTFFKYNPEKTLAWLAIKTKRIIDILKKIGVHCGHSSISSNYNKTDKEVEEMVSEVDYLRMACDIVGSYLDYDLHQELIQYLEIPSEIQEEKSAAQKRKSLQSLNSKGNKKLKMDESVSGATSKLKDGDLLDDSVEEAKPTSPPVSEFKPTPLKEKVLTAKEKALAKGAKGTKSISSFFTKK